jgi:NAD(P)-dependent dehydrogenase (short-subunit alcohol dehydrogenase family)
MTKVVAITGATGTLGQAVLKKFSKNGWGTIEGDSRNDVIDPNALYYWLKQRAPAGGIDALVTCAGVALVKPSLELTANEWEKILRVNLSGTFYAVQAAVRRGAKRVVTIGSIHGSTPTSYPQRVAYTASKAGVMGLTQALAVEFAPLGVSINCVAPGHLPHLMSDLKGAGQALLDAAAERTPAGRLVTPEEVAEVIFWLCDGAPPTLTGQILTIDGAFVANSWPL